MGVEKDHTEGGIVPIERIEGRILVIRGHRVILDADLAELFGVPTKRLNEQVRRNPERFPRDFAFRLTRAEKAYVVANCDHLPGLRFSPALPNAFTEHGAIMAANVLNGRRAVEASVYVVRAFVRLRQVLTTHRELAEKLAELERRLDTHDRAIREIVTAIHELMEPPEEAPEEPPRDRIGFHPRRRSGEGARARGRGRAGGGGDRPWRVGPRSSRSSGSKDGSFCFEARR